MPSFVSCKKQIDTIPGVKTATFSGSALLAGTVPPPTLIPMEKFSQHKHAWANVVGADFFGTIGIPIVAGRGFNDGDSESSPK